MIKIYNIFIVQGNNEDEKEKIVFATSNKEVAENYITKANNLLEKLKSYFKEDIVFSDDYDKVYPHPQWRAFEVLKTVEFYFNETELRN